MALPSSQDTATEVLACSMALWRTDTLYGHRVLRSRCWHVFFSFPSFLLPSSLLFPSLTPCHCCIHSLFCLSLLKQRDFLWKESTMTQRFTLGVEEEFQMVDKRT